MKASGKIQKIEPKVAKNNKNYSVYTIDGEMFGVWPEWHKDFNEGDEIEFEYEVKGKYKNIIEAEAVDKIGWEKEAKPVPIEVKSGMSLVKKYQDKTKESMLKFNCLNNASLMIANDPEGKPEQVLILAKKLFEQWKSFVCE